RNDPCHFSVRMKISIGKRGKDHRSVDTGSARTLEIFVERSGGVSRLSQAVAFSGMTMAVDNHGALVDCLRFCETAAGQPGAIVYGLSTTIVLPRRHQRPLAVVVAVADADPARAARFSAD